MMTKARIYLAGGMQSDWQEIVKRDGPEARYLDPCSHGLQDEKHYTAWDLASVKRADIVFVYFEASNSSGYGLSLSLIHI